MTDEELNYWHGFTTNEEIRAFFEGPNCRQQMHRVFTDDQIDIICEGIMNAVNNLYDGPSKITGTYRDGSPISTKEIAYMIAQQIALDAEDYYEVLDD